jgi:hypothetical protein
MNIARDRGGAAQEPVDLLRMEPSEAVVLQRVDRAFAQKSLRGVASFRSR